MHEFVLKFFPNAVQYYECALCGKIFRLTVDKAHLDIHIEKVHGLTKEEIIQGPKSSLKASTAFNTMTSEEDQTGKVCQKGKENSSSSSVESTLSPIQTIYKNNAHNQQIIPKFFKKIPNGYSCSICERKFIKEPDHVLVCHISMAHPSLKTENAIVKPKLPLANAATLSHKENEPNISEYFTRPNGRLQCVLCKLFFSKSRHCLSHMKIRHGDIYSTLPLVERKMPRKHLLTKQEKQERLKLLNYDPNAEKMYITLKYDDSDKNNITCDFFEQLEDEMQCLICDAMIKTKTAHFLQEHLLMSHKIYDITVIKTNVACDEPAVKKPKLMTPKMEPNQVNSNATSSSGMKKNEIRKELDVTEEVVKIEPSRGSNLSKVVDHKQD